MNDNVTKLKTKRKPEPKGPLELVHRYGGCQHAHVEVCEKQAEVTCADCGEKLNPIWVLMRLATDDRILINRWASLKAEVRLMAERTRVKCRHCDRFTPVTSGASNSQILELAEKIKREEL